MVKKEKQKRKKNGRPRAGKEVTKKLLSVAAVKHDGKVKDVAKELEISHQAASKHLNKPDVKKVVLSARAIAIKKAGLSRIKAYKQLANQMSAKKAGEVITGRGKTKKVETVMVNDWPAQDQARKDFLKIVGDYVDDTSTDGDGKTIPFIIILPQVTSEPKPPKADTIDV